MLALFDLNKAPEADRPASLQHICDLDQRLKRHFREKFLVQPILNRQLVSFQANKSRPAYRWYKYKEAFSASLVEYLLCQYGRISGKMLDPFAGSGTALFAASAAGIDADGIELLPIGQQIILSRLTLERDFTPDDFDALNRWITTRPWQTTSARSPLRSLHITAGAYPPETVDAIERYMAAWWAENERVQIVLRFALLCILESVSYTRKDGQYLRWDYRSGRKQGAKPFHKGPIPPFDQAICAKLAEILEDTQPENELLPLFC